MIRVFKIIGLAFLLILAGYICVLCFPSFLFSNLYEKENLRIYSDKPFPEQIESISSSTLKRIKKSEYYDVNRVYRVYISNDMWRWKFLSNLNSGAGAINTTWFRGNSFVRPSVIAENRIIPPSANMADSKQRDLIYYLSHEITHGMMSDKVGEFDFQFNTELWVREGYADLIGKSSFDFSDNIQQLENGEWRLTEESGLYVRYHLFVEYLLKEKGLTMKDLILNPPKKSAVLEELLQFKIENDGLTRLSN